MVDSRRYSAGSFITVASLGDDVFEGTITGVTDGKYDKLNLEFEDGSKLSVNATNLRTLQDSYGYETDAWTGKRVKLVTGELEFANKPVDSVILSPLTPKAKGKSKSAKSDDAVPF